MQRRVWAADGARVARTPFEIFIRYSHKSDRAAFYEDLCRLLSDVPFYYSLTAVPQKIRFLGKLEQSLSIRFERDVSLQQTLLLLLEKTLLIHHQFKGDLALDDEIAMSRFSLYNKISKKLSATENNANAPSDTALASTDSFVKKILTSAE